MRVGLRLIGVDAAVASAAAEGDPAKDAKGGSGDEDDSPCGDSPGGGGQ